MPQYLNILLQKSDPNLSWGFDVIGGCDTTLPLIIYKVNSNSFSSQYLCEGDRIVQIEGLDTSLLTEVEAKTFIKKPSKSLDLIIYKTGNSRCQESPLKNPETNVIKHTTFNRKHSDSQTSRNWNPNTNSTQITSFERENIHSQNSKPTVSYTGRRNSQFTSKNDIRKTETEYDNNSTSEYSSSRLVNSKYNDRMRTNSFWNQNTNYLNEEHFEDEYSTSTLSSLSDLDYDQETTKYHSNSRDNNLHQVTFRNSCSNNKNAQGALASFNCIRNDSPNLNSSTVIRIQDFHENTAETENHLKCDICFKQVIPVGFNFYRQSSPSPQHSECSYENLDSCNDTCCKNISKVYLSSSQESEINIIQYTSCAANSLSQTNYQRQPSKTSESGYEPEGQSEDNSDVSPTTCLPTSGPPTPPVPPPPPPPSLNGGVLPTIRLKSEISERNEPPAKLQNAMLKDKKPFTYTPGGIDLSEIKSPRMQRRIVRNAQTPDDIILPPTNTSPVNPNLLPPSTIAAMTPQMAIPVFPQNNKPLKKYNSGNQPLVTNPQHKHDTSSPHKPNVPQSSAQKSDVPPPPPPHKNSNPQLSIATTDQNPPIQKMMTERQPTVSVNNKSNISVTNINETKNNVNATSHPSSKGHGNNMNRVGTLYIPPVTNVESNTNTLKQNSSPPTFPVLREAPTPWLQKHQQQSESVPAWANKNNVNDKAKEKIYERKAQVTPVQTYKEASNENISNSSTHIIPIQIEGSPPVNQQNQRSTSQRWSNTSGEDFDQSVRSHENIRNTSNIPNKNYSESESKPIQSRSFKVIQKITGSDDDSTSFNHHVPSTEGVPLNQLRKLQLNEDDQKFMNRVKAQANQNDTSQNSKAAVSIYQIKNDDDDDDDEIVDDDTFLHMETDPRYRGAVIPSRAFRMLQNMTDTGQVTNTINANNCPTSHTPVKENASANYTHRNNSSVTAQPNRINSNSNVKTQERPNVTVYENETEKPSSKRAYIPPSERQAEQELRKYMGSSIPSRSFKMLQAMTATNDTSGRPDESDF